MYRPRLLEEIIANWWRVVPVVVLVGARQTGKSTLLKRMLSRESILDLDDLALLTEFRRRPDVALRAALRGMPPGPVGIDEVQRLPDLLIAIKQIVDQGDRRGFLLTGSADLRLMERCSESLAGRAHFLEVMPLAVSEWEGRVPAFLGDLLERGAREVRETAGSPPAEWSEFDVLRRRLLRHGTMPPLLERPGDTERGMWLSAWRRTYLERDVGELSSSIDPGIFSRPRARRPPHRRRPTSREVAAAVLQRRRSAE